MAAQMLNFDSFKQSLIEDVRVENNWSDTESEGYDADTEMNKLLEKVAKCPLNKSTVSQNFHDAQSPANSSKESVDTQANKLMKSDINNKNSATVASDSLVNNFFSFFNEELLKEVVNCTNTHIAVARKYYSRERDCQNTDLEEIKVFIGLLILAGLLKLNLKLDELWEMNGIGVEVFRLSMSLKRFKFLLTYVNFTKTSKVEKIGKNPEDGDFVDIVGTFMENCIKNFEINTKIIISRKYLMSKSKLDKQLDSSTKSSGFIVYFIMDSDHGYISNLEFHDKKKFDVVKEQSILHHEAVEGLLKLRTEGTTFILDESCRNVGNIETNFNSSIHQEVENTHNFTTEEILSKYSVFDRTKRLLLKLLVFMIDVACLNSFIIHYSTKTDTLSRKEFLKKLGLSLVKNQIEKRSTCSHLSRELRDQAATYLLLKPVVKTLDKTKNKPVRCIVCPRKSDKKVRSFCCKCAKPMCQSHLISLCSECINVE